MQARVENQGEIVVIYLGGRVDVETAEAFRSACLNHLTGKSVVFDFKSLSFVGSSGILPFLETMQDFAKSNEKGFKFSSVGSEFKKVFGATPLNVIEIHETPQMAVHAFLNPQLAPAPPKPVYAAPTVDQREEQFGLLSFAREEDTTGHQRGGILSPDALEEESAD